MIKFHNLLALAFMKGYRSFHTPQELQDTRSHAMELVMIYTWMHVTFKIDLPIVFIEGGDNEKQIDMLIETIEKIDNDPIKN